MSSTEENYFKSHFPPKKQHFEHIKKNSFPFFTSNSLNAKCLLRILKWGFVSSQILLFKTRPFKRKKLVNKVGVAHNIYLLTSLWSWWNACQCKIMTKLFHGCEPWEKYFNIHLFWLGYFHRSFFVGFKIHWYFHWIIWPPGWSCLYVRPSNYQSFYQKRSPLLIWISFVSRVF